MNTMKIIACSIIDGDTTIVPFLEYMYPYSIKYEDKNEQEKYIKQETRILDTIKYLYEHKGAGNLPPYIEFYRNYEFSVIKIKLGNKLVRIPFKTINSEILLLNAFEKPERYEKSLKDKVDREIQQSLDDAKRILAFYISEHRGIDITAYIVS